METGLIFNLQQFSTEDGPGIRTTVFLKGCPLRCPWCHNPEGLHPEPDLMWYDIRCLGLKDCLKVCPEKALNLRPEGMQIDRDGVHFAENAGMLVRQGPWKLSVAALPPRS